MTDEPVWDAAHPIGVHAIDNPMRYVESSGEQVRMHKHVEEALTTAYNVLLACCPRSAERTLAIRKLQEARMWANAAIAFDGRTYPL